MTISVLTATRQTVLSNYAANFDAGALEIYSGSVPADVNASLGAAVLLGSLTFGSPAFSVSGGTATANAITQCASAAAAGTASFYRARKTGGGAYIEQGTISTSGADLNMNTTTVYLGGPIQCTSFIRTW